MLHQIYMMCYFPNEVTIQSQLVSYSLFSSDWFTWNKQDKKMALMMLMFFDLPIQFHSINPRFKFNLKAFSWVKYFLKMYFYI